jgi:predicted Zn-dependent protease
VAGITLLCVLVWTTIRPLSKAIAHRIPLDVERGMVGQIEQRMAPGYCESDAAIEALAELSSRLLGQKHDFPPTHILNLEIPNAFALPGGTVILTRGLMEFSESPDEIAGVLAHELEHVRQRHVMAGVIRGTLLSALWAVSVGDFSGMMVIDPSTAFQIATLEFSREDEAEADRGALEMLERASIHSDGLSDFFERLEAKGEELPEWLSSHPASARRATAATVRIEAGAALRPALSPEAWQAVKQACQDAPAPEVGLQDFLF